MAIERTFLQKIIDSFKRGDAISDAAIAISEALNGNDPDELQEALNNYYSIEATNQTDPISGSTMMNLLYRASSTVGSIFDEIKNTGIGAIAGAVLGGAVGMLAGPAGVVAGAGLGAELGAGVTAGLFAFRSGRGMLFADMKAKGLDDSTSDFWSQVGGLAMVPANLVGLGSLMAPAKQVVTKEASQLLRKSLISATSKAALTYGKSWGTQVTGATLNKALALIAEESALEMHNHGIDIDKEHLINKLSYLADGIYEVAGHKLSTLGKTAIEAAQDFALLPIPGALMEAGVGYALHRQSLPLSPHLIEKGRLQIASSNLSKNAKYKANRFLDKLAVEEGIAKPISKVQEELKAPTPAGAKQPWEQLNDIIHDWAVELPEMQKRERISIKKETGKRIKEMDNVWKDHDDPVVGFYAGLKELGGPLKDQEFSPLKNVVTEDMIRDAYRHIRDEAPLDSFDKIHAVEGLNRLVFEGLLPQESQLIAMETAFGKGFVQDLVLARKKLKNESAWSKFVDELNLARSLMVSMDMSFALRQGALLAPVSPKQWGAALASGYRAFSNPKYVDFIDLMRQTNPNYTRLKKLGLAETLIGSPVSGEELWASSMASKVPGVKASERAFTTMSNELRWNSVYKILEQNPNISDADLKWVIDFHNNATGRGNLPNFLKKYSNTLNALIFAPKLHIGHAKALLDIFNPMNLTSKIRRKIIAKELVGFVGGGLGLLALAKSNPGVKVEDDPRSADFGRLIVGNTRIDIWAGYQPLVRAIVQLCTGQQKSTVTGRVLDVERRDIITRFLRSKMAPVPGLAIDIFTGQTFFGEKIDYNSAQVDQMIYERLTPLFFQDVIDAMRYSGLSTGLMVAPLAWHGIGTLTYKPQAGSDLFHARNKFAQETFGQNWDDIGPEAQKALTNAEPLLRQLEAQMKAERSDYSFLSLMLENQTKVTKQLQSKLPEAVQTEMRRLDFPMPGLSRTIGNGWYLNDKRYSEYQTLVQAQLQAVLPAIIESDGWKALPPLVRAKLLKNLFDDIYTRVRRLITNKANINDLVHRKQIHG
jgi:hypothetical protein